MDDTDCCCSNGRTLDIPREVTSDVMIKEIAPVYERSECLISPRRRVNLYSQTKTSQFESDSLQDLKEQIITGKPSLTTGKPSIYSGKSCTYDGRATREEDSGIELAKFELRLLLDDVENVYFNLMCSIQPRYINKEYFSYTFVFESNQMVESSFCYDKLKLRNGDQLLMINDEDVTIMTHSEVLRLIERLPISENERITMAYWRPDTDHIVENNFNLTIPERTAVVVESFHEKALPRRSWKPKRKITINKRATFKFMQLLEKTIVFTELKSSLSGQNINNFHKCHFIEELTTEFHETGLVFLRRYKDERYNKYLFVSPTGDIQLHEHDYAIFKTKYDNKKAFCVIMEQSTGRLLCIENQVGKFVKPKHHESIQCWADAYKFEIKVSQCNSD